MLSKERAGMLQVVAKMLMMLNLITSTVWNLGTTTLRTHYCAQPLAAWIYLHKLVRDASRHSRNLQDLG